jgi:hypothetical protein
MNIFILLQVLITRNRDQTVHRKLNLHTKSSVCRAGWYTLNAVNLDAGRLSIRVLVWLTAIMVQIFRSRPVAPLIRRNDKLTLHRIQPTY